jgi:hypothetical protein
MRVDLRRILVFILWFFEKASRSGMRQQIPQFDGKNDDI